MPCTNVALLSLCFSLLCFRLLVRTRSRPYGLHHCPYTLAHIKGFGSSILHVYACLLLCFMLVLASLVLGFATLDVLSGRVVVWYIWRSWGPVWMQPLATHCHDASCFVHAFTLFRSVRLYACHACLCHPLALSASLHACLHVHAWVLLASVSFVLQHNEVMDIRSKLLFLVDTTFCLLSDRKSVV